MPCLKVRHSVLKVICGNDITPKQRQIHTLMQVESTSAKDRCYDLLCADHCEHSLCWAENISAKTRGPVPSADPQVKQNQAPTQALAALAHFRTNRQKFGLA